jgi:hypothetical protein
MLGGWGAGDIPSPPQANPATRKIPPGQSANTVSSELLIDILPRYETGTQDSVSPNADKQHQAEMAYMKEQLVVAFSKISVLEEMVAGQAAMLTNQQTWNSAMSTESRNTSSRVVEADAKAEAAHTAAKAAENAIRSVDSKAKKAADMAGKALQITADTQNQLRALEASMTAINKKQQDLAQHLSGPPLAQADQAGANSKLLDTSENSIFFAGVQQYRRRLNLHPQSDPIFVVSVLLKEMGIYAGMDSIVLADNAAKTRQDARAVIIHMQSNFHSEEGACYTETAGHSSERLLPVWRDGHSEKVCQIWDGVEDNWQGRQIPGGQQEGQARPSDWSKEPELY